MAKLRALKARNKRFVFTAYGNDKDASPAVVIFERFPRSGELYFSNLKTKIVGKDENGKDKIQLDGSPIFEAGDFARDCINRFENLEYGDGRTIKTVEDFLSLPQTAVESILLECCNYAMEQDEFTMGE